MNRKAICIFIILILIAGILPIESGAEADVLFTSNFEKGLAADGWSLSNPSSPLGDNIHIIDSQYTGTLKHGEIADGCVELFVKNGVNSGVYMSAATKAIKGEWYAEITMNIVSLMKYYVDYGWRGLCLRVYDSEGRDTHIVFRKDGIFQVKNTNGNIREALAFDYPDDGKMHTYGFYNDGIGNITYSLDGIILGSRHSNALSETKNSIVLGVDAWNEETENSSDMLVILDSVKIFSGKPGWLKPIAGISQVSLTPDSVYNDINVSATVVDFEKYSGTLDVEATLCKTDGTELSSQSKKLSDTDGYAAYRFKMSGSEYPDRGEYILKFKVKDEIAVISEFAKRIFLPQKAAVLAPSKKSVDSSDGITYILTDLLQYLPQDSSWETGKYTVNGFDGEYFWIYGKNGKSEFNVPLKASGKYALSVGYFNIDGNFKYYGSSEKAIASVSLSKFSGAPGSFIREAYLGVVDFNGGNIGKFVSAGKLAYIRLRPIISDEELDALNEEYDGEKRLILNNDGWSSYPEYTSEEQLVQRVLTQHNDRYAYMVDWSLGDIFASNDFSELLGNPYSRLTDSDMNGWRQIDHDMKNSILNFIDKGVSPAKVLLDAVADNTPKVGFALRAIADYTSLNSVLLKGRDRMRVKNYDGSDQNCMSYYYTEVQDFIIERVKDALSVDGRGKQAESFTFDLARYPYNLGYEIEPYMKEKYGFGISGKERLFGDELKAYNKAKSEIMNAFMTRLREATKGVKLMVRFEYDTIEKYGLDIEYWVKNGLVDVIIPGKISYEDFGDYSYYAKLVENTGVTLYGGITSDLDGQDLTAQEEQLMNSGVSVNIYNSTVNTEQYYTRAYRLYKLGCEKLYIFNNWNATDIPDDLGNKNAVYRYNLFKYPCDCVTSGAKFGEKLGDVTEAIIAQAYANSDDTPEDGINAVPVAVKWAIGIAAAAICAAAAVLLVLRKKRNKRI